ncbi:hypothetical protein [Streptomyces sp. SID13726]|uniref:hypothetical protein n=1 Tax=Streptomyces sp. SID13726 TaxID=2706058 RepID=UPI0013BB3F93|nr:hypothetical protein [Streptomyces sp. SID13726]NEB01902.1 hypothetical protein [Streptomyces sp. SID13726]
MTVVPPPRTLPDEMALLLPSTAPDLWRAAVERAAHLLAPSWQEHPSLDLTALSFLLLMWSAEREQSPASLSAEAVAEELSVQGEQPQELRDLSRRIEAAATDAGVLGRGYGPGTLDPLWADLSCWSEASDDEAEGHPPALWAAVGRLRDVISGLTEAALRHASPPHPSLGTWTVSVSHRVRVVSPAAILSITCTTCGSREGGELHIDGPAVAFVCTHGHDTTTRRLEVQRVRNALAHAGLPAGADVSVEGDLHVTHRDCHAQSDPRHLSRFTAAVLA